MLRRTYSRKGAKRSSMATNTTGSLEASPERSQTPSPQRQRKRQKIQVEVVQSLTPSPSRDSAGDAGSGAEQSRAGNNEDSKRNISKPLRTFSSRRPDPSADTSKPCTPSPRHVTTSSSVRSLKRSDTSREDSISPVKNLSELFTFSGLSQSKRSEFSPKPSGVAKRMHPLRRAQTDSSVTVGSSSISERLHSTPRRLAGTRTESIIDLTLSRTGTAESSAAGHSDNGSPTPHKGHHVTDDPLSALRPSLGATSTNNIRTYGGKSRTFLVALPVSHADSPAEEFGGSSSRPSEVLNMSQEEEFDTRESYTTLRQRWGVDNSEDDPMPPTESNSNSPKRKGKGKGTASVERLPEGMMNDLKSISELRSKGEARRFLDEVGYLFEGLDPDCASNVKRGSALEIVSKLCDAEFARRAQAADFLSKTWETLRAAGAGQSTGDKVLNTILAFFAALVAKDESDIAELAFVDVNLVAVLYDMLIHLTFENDPLWLISSGLHDAETRKLGLGKGDKAVLVGLWQMVKRKSGLFSEDEEISNRLLISFALSRLPTTFCSVDHLPMLLKSLDREISQLPPRITAYTSGLQLLQTLSSSSYKETPSVSHMDNCLKLLSGVLLRRWENVDDVEMRNEAEHADSHWKLLDEARKEGLAKLLVSLCVTMDIMTRESRRGEQRQVVEQCTQSVLRVLINLTHDSQPWCQAVLHEPLASLAIIRLITTAQSQRRRLDAFSAVKRESSDPAIPSARDADLQLVEEDDDNAQLTDRLCLALGLLTNLVQGATEAKEVVGDTYLSLQCRGTRSCVRICTCSSRISALECLVHVYTQLCESTSDFDTVVRGHVAVLFGLLMQDNRKNQQTMLRSLPGGESRAKLNSLLENARDFMAFYVRFSKKAAEAVGEGMHEEGDTEIRSEGGRTGDQVWRGPDGSLQGVLHDAKGEDVAEKVIRFLETMRRRPPDIDKD